MSEKFSTFWRKLFGRVVKTASDVCIGSFWEVVFEKKNQIHLSSLHTQLTFIGIQSKIFQQGCQKTIQIFNLFLALSANVSPFCPENFQQDCQNWILFVYRNRLEEKFPRKNVRKSFCLFRTLSKKILAFFNLFFGSGCQKCVLRVNRNTATENIF